MDILHLLVLLEFNIYCADMNTIKCRQTFNRVITPEVCILSAYLKLFIFFNSPLAYAAL